MDRNGDPDRVAPVACDMGPGFSEGMRGHPPDAARVIDEFHVVRHANGAVDKVRRTQATAGKRYVTISNPTLAHRRFPNISR
jgi:transposase